MYGTPTTYAFEYADESYENEEGYDVVDGGPLEHGTGHGQFADYASLQGRVGVLEHHPGLEPMEIEPEIPTNRDFSFGAGVSGSEQTPLWNQWHSAIELEPTYNLLVGNQQIRHPLTDEFLRQQFDQAGFATLQHRAEGLTFSFKLGEE
ncbi:hypothetical protein HDU93_001487, partial [Gonapodya sp. JEL0774]